MNYFLKNVIHLLHCKNMSWYQLSKETGIPESSLADYHKKRKNDIKIEDANKIAKVLKKQIDDLVNIDLEKQIEEYKSGNNSENKKQ